MVTSITTFPSFPSVSKNIGETRVFLHAAAAPTVHWRLKDEAQEEVKGDGDS